MLAVSTNRFTANSGIMYAERRAYTGNTTFVLLPAQVKLDSYIIQSDESSKYVQWFFTHSIQTAPKLACQPSAINFMICD